MRQLPLRRRFAPAPLLALLVAVGPSAAATGSPDEVAVLVAEALERSPDLAAARSRVAAARARVAPAGALPDPMVSLTYENDGVEPSLGEEPMTRLSLMAEQPLPYPGKLRLAAEVAAADARLEEPRIARLALSVEAEVRRAHARLVEAREGLAILSEQERTWGEIEEAARGRYAAGLGSQQDVLRAQAERTRLRQQRFRDEGAERTALVELQRLLRRDGPGPVPTATRYLPGPALPLPDPSEAMARAERDSPELAEARLLVEREAVAVTLSRRNLAPDFLATAAYMNRGSLPLMWQLGVGVSVPLFSGRKQRPLIVEAESRLEAAKAALGGVRTRLLARTEQRLVGLRQLADEAALDAGALLVQDRLAVEAALASYRSGSVPFVTVLEALVTELGDRRAALGRRAAFERSLADLHELSLDPPAEGSSSASSPTPRAGMSGASGM